MRISKSIKTKKKLIVFIMILCIFLLSFLVANAIGIDIERSFLNDLRLLSVTQKDNQTKEKTPLSSLKPIVGTEQKKEQHSINIVCSDGGRATTNVRLAFVGENINIAITPDVGFEVVEIRLNDKPVNATEFIMPDENVSIYIGFGSIGVPRYQVEKAVTKDGSFTVSKFSVTANETFDLSVYPTVGYELDAITATNATVNGFRITASGTGNIVVSVTFKKTIWNITSNKDTVQNGSFTVDKRTAVVGDTILINTNIDTGYEIDTITATNATVTGNKITANGTGDIHINVLFKKIIWNVSSNKDTVQNGSFTVDKATATIGDLISVNVSPNTGYIINTITATNATVNGNIITASGTGNIDIVVTYKKNIVKVTSNKDTVQNGSFTVDKKTAVVGDTILINTNIDTGYEIDTITATNATVNGNIITANGTGDIHINVLFKKIIWKVKRSAPQNGELALTRETAGIGDEVIASLSPSTGYVLESFTATNSIVQNDTIISDGTGDIEVNAIYRKKNDYLTLNGNEYTAITGGWTSTTNGANGYNSYYNTGNALYLSINWWQTQCHQIRTRNKIDMTDIEMLVANVSGASYALGDRDPDALMSFCVQSAETSGYYNEGVARVSNQVRNPAGSYRFVLDVANLNGSYYPALRMWGVNSTVGGYLNSVEVVYKDKTPKATPNYLYLNGNEYIPTTAGWNYEQSGGNSSGTLRKDSTSMYFKSHWWSSHYASAVTSRKIDLSNVKQIEATLSGSDTILGDKGGATGYLSLEIQNAPNGAAVASTFWGNPKGDRTLVVDTSNLNGSYHIAIKGGGYDSNVYTNITAVKVIFKDGTTKIIKSEFVDNEKLNNAILKNKNHRQEIINGNYLISLLDNQIIVDITADKGYLLKDITIDGIKIRENLRQRSARVPLKKVNADIAVTFIKVTE